jgi:hypothetical protein
VAIRKGSHELADADTSASTLALAAKKQVPMIKPNAKARGMSSLEYEILRLHIQVQSMRKAVPKVTALY